MKTLYRVAVEGDLGSREEDVVIAEVVSASVSDVISIGDDNRKWRVIKTETYKSENEEICLALVALQSQPVPPNTMWTHNVIREGDPLGLHVMFDGSGQILATGVTLNGKPPIYPLMTEEQTWFVDQIETYFPQSQSGEFEQVQFCYCVAVNQNATV